MDKGPLLLENFSNMKSQKVKVDESFVPVLEDEAAEVRHLLAEPKGDNVSVDGVLCFNKENSRKSSGMEDFSCGFEFGFSTTYANDLSTACEDFLLDIEFAEKFTELDCDPIEGSRLGNLSAESLSPGFSGSNVAVGISDTSTITAPDSECKNDSLNKILTCESHSTLTSKCECQLPVEEKSPSSHDVHKFDELDNDDNLLLSSILSKSKKRVKSSVLGTKVQRLRKPTQRYIEESSDLKSGYLMGGQNVSTATLKDKQNKVKSHNGSSDERSCQAPSTSWLRGERLKNFSPVSGFESDDIFSSDSDDDHARKRKSKADVDRRKHQRMWTLSEVMKLIDGISQFGVGKWTDIKRLLFSSSAHRTPIDLRDKWRNLLRASCAPQKNKGEVDQKHAVRTLPNPVLSRIRELATIHPYPRVPMSKISRKVSKHPTKAKGVSFSSNGRNLRRKKHT